MVDGLEKKEGSLPKRGSKQVDVCLTYQGYLENLILTRLVSLSFGQFKLPVIPPSEEELPGILPSAVQLMVPNQLQKLLREFYQEGSPISSMTKTQLQHFLYGKGEGQQRTQTMDGVPGESLSLKF